VTVVGSPVDAVIDECASLVRERRYSRHPFVAELDRIRPRRAALGRWGSQKYHQVYLQNVIFSAIHANAREHEDVRQYTMDQLVAEETDRISGDAPHYVLMRRFAEACGEPSSSFASERCTAEVRAYVDELLALCRDQPFPIGLLVIHAIESQSGEAAGRLLAWLRANGFSEAELAWFVVHAEDEDDHAEAGLALVRRHAPTVEQFGELAVASTDRITLAWLRLHDHYVRLLEEG
jgi:pyrroloquinoline-quinone synthase